jgi:hypothetical protein
MFSPQFPFVTSLVVSLTLTVLTKAAPAPLCPELIKTAGGGLPNITLPATVSQSALKEIQLAQFLENVEVNFFSTGSANITEWGTGGYSNDTIDIVSKIAAVSLTSDCQ